MKARCGIRQGVTEGIVALDRTAHHRRRALQLPIYDVSRYQIAIRDVPLRQAKSLQCSFKMKLDIVELWKSCDQLEQLYSSRTS